MMRPVVLQISWRRFLSCGTAIEIGSSPAEGWVEYRPSAAAATPALHLQNFFELRQISGAALGHERHVFQAHAAKVGIIESRLNGDHVPGSQCRGRGGTDPRKLVDLQAESMSGAMKKALHPPVTFAGLVS